MIAAELRMARSALGMTQQQMAEALGISRQHLSRLEHGYPISATIALAVESLVRREGFDPKSVRLWKGPVTNPQELVSNLFDPDDDVAGAVARWRKGAEDLDMRRETVESVLALYSHINSGGLHAAACVLATLDIGPLLDPDEDNDRAATVFETVRHDPNAAAWLLVERAVDAALGGRLIAQQEWQAAQRTLAEYLGPWLKNTW